MTDFLPLETETARRRLAEFRRSLAWRDRGLSEPEREEARLEAEAHLAEAFAAAQGEESDRLEAAIAAFGDLPDAPPAWRKPLAIVLHYGALPVIGVVGLFVLALLHMAAMDVLNPSQVGLWVYPDGDFSLSYEAQEGAREVLGPGFAFAAIGLSIGLGWSLLLLWRFAVSPSGQVARWMQDDAAAAI